MQVFTLTALLSLLAPPSQSESVRIYGNAYGLWSPTHPHLTKGKSKPNSPVLYTPPLPDLEPVVTETPDVCPTLNSAPHLCQPSI